MRTQTSDTAAVRGAPGLSATGPLPLLAAAHPGPAVAVTVVTALLAVADDLSPLAAVGVTAAVLAGQLTIGWGNDLVDAARDGAVGRAGKPLSDGGVPVRVVGWSIAVAGVACVLLSFAVGWRSGVVHLVLGVAMGHAYNLALKSTAWSWLPYAVAFGALPAVVSLAGSEPAWPGWWVLAAGAALGVGAHLLDTLPDLADDERTGVRGLPHRLGERRARLLAAGMLTVASLLAGLGGGVSVGRIVALALVGVLVAVSVVGRGQVPFRAAVGVALLDVVLIVAAAR